MRPLVPLVVSVSVMASAAHAATWSPPESLSRAPHTFVGPLQAAAGPTGAAVAAWPWQDGTGQHATTGASTAGRLPRGGAFGSERAAPAGLVAVGTFADSRTIALIETSAGGTQRMRLSVAFGSTTGRLGTARTLRVAPILFRPQLAVNTHGSALFAWVEVVRSASGTRHIVRIAERLSSSASHPPVALPGRGYVQGLAVAVGDRGDAVAAVVREGRLLARVRRPGHPWGLFSQLARATAGSKTTWQLSAAIDGRGNVRVVWRRHEFSRPGIPGRLALQDAVMAAGSARFRRAETIEPDGAGEPVLRLTSAGWTLAYMHQTPDGPRPALRLSSPAGTFSAVRYAAPAQRGARGTDVVSTPAGDIVLAWIQPVTGQNSDGEVRAAALSPGAPVFGPVEAVSPAEAAHEVRLVPGPADDEVQAVWSARPEGTGPGIPIASIHTVVRSAVRTP